jgi:hypothetical protein
MGERRSAYRFWYGNWRERADFVNLGIHGRQIEVDLKEISCEGVV